MRIKTATLALAIALVSAFVALPPLPCKAEPFPSRVIRLIVPFPAGGGGDVLARLVTHYMSEDLGQTVAVINTPGADGALAFGQVAHAAPDGYTITWTSVIFPLTATTMDQLNFNPATDFTHIGEVAENPFILVVNPKLPVKTVADLVALAKAKPKVLNFAENGGGTLTKLALDLFQIDAGIDLTEVSYRGDNFSIADVVAGHVDGMFSNSPVALPHMAAGELRGLAVTSPKRSSAAPQLPTMAEAGVPDFQAVVWHGLSGPAGMPRPIVDRLNASLNKALANPVVVAQLKKAGVAPAGGTSDAYQALVSSEIRYWATAVKRAKEAGK